MGIGKKLLLSGVKPTGRPHIGNYFGAMKQFVALQSEYDSIFFIADYHALTTLHDPVKLAEYTLGVALDYLAIGLDPKRALIFKQSDIPAHTELAWIFNCITAMPYLLRGHAYKDAEAKNEEVTVGTFDYPMLMAADILLYDTDVVPVGQDQKQHLEFARDTAEKFNRLFGETFKLPEPHIVSEVAAVPGLDGRKMSKSYDNTIPLFADDDEIERLVMSIVTDSKGEREPKDPAADTVFALHRLVSAEQLDELKKRYEEGTIGYKESKEILAENMKKFAAPLREKRRELEEKPEYAKDALAQGAEVARKKSEEKMKEVRRKVGVAL